MIRLTNVWIDDSIVRHEIVYILYYTHVYLYFCCSFINVLLINTYVSNSIYCHYEPENKYKYCNRDGKLKTCIAIIGKKQFITCTKLQFVFDFCFTFSINIQIIVDMNT